MPLITANEAALIQRNLTRNACDVAKCDAGIARVQELARHDPELRGLARALRELRDTAQPMLFCDMASAA